MFIGNQAALLRGASPLALAPERKEETSLTTEVKEAVEKLGRTFEAFKTKNDEHDKQVDKKFDDVVTKEEVARINKAIDAAKDELKKELDKLEAKANRMALGAGGDGAVEAKAAASFGELVGKADYSAEDLKQYRADLGGYLRRNEHKATTMQVASDPSGGFWVTPDVSGRMVKKIYESTPIRQLANVVSIGTDRLEGPIDNGEADAEWVGELSTRSQTGLPQLGMWSIDVHELYAYPRVTQKLLEDAKIDVESWIADKAASKFARKEAAAFINGDGSQKPRGLLNYPTATTADDTRAWGTFQFVGTGTSGGFGAGSNGSDKLIDLIYEVKAQYRQMAKWLMARRTVGNVRKLKDGDGNYLYGLRLQDGALVESIFGFPVADGEDMPAVAANSLSIAFGDFAEAYMIVERLGTSVIRDNITQPGFVKFLMRRRVGGGAVNFEAVKFLKFA